MEYYYYIILLAILVILAASDLVVGVSNDAVNFLNSAIGSKAIPVKTIMIIASVGVAVGAVSSSGMMEVARKGIFDPSQYYFDEILILFLAVMITDVLLLDLFNTLGMPTSTTVSIVFELLGAAVALAIIKISNNPDLNMGDLSRYINSDTALFIIAGILMSVIIAFSVGAFVQYISRMMFSFQYKKNLKYFGGVFGGFAITAITYFIFIKGLKGTDFYDKTKDFIDTYELWMVLGSLVFWTITCQIATFFKLNVMKFIIGIGTFSLAMAFAGNDLVNFIGVPIAAYQSFEAWSMSGVAPSEFLMDSMGKKVATPTFLLFLAGLIMVVTLWFSKKAKRVVQTELNLARQGDSEERFAPNMLSRNIVHFSMYMSEKMDAILPKEVMTKIEARFKQAPPKKLTKKEKKNEPAFDQVRASVNMVVAGILISIGTSLKLPLSTTYVTFMVAMGTSLADRAWDRESAVYRIAGVTNVIGGWFLTAFIAFTAAATLASVIYFGRFIGSLLGSNELGMLIIVLALAALILYLFISRSKRKPLALEREEVIEELDEEADRKEIIAKSTRNVLSILKNVANVYENSIDGLLSEDFNLLKKMVKKSDGLNTKAKKLKDKVHHIIHDLNAVSLESGHHYVQVAGYMREIAHSLVHTVNPMYDHLANKHKQFIEEQATELKDLSKFVEELYKDVKKLIENEEYHSKDVIKLLKKQNSVLKFIKQLNKEQIKRIKQEKVGTRNSILYLSILNETKNLILNTGNLTKSFRDFATENEEEIADN